ncbi:MAG: type II toxin-antitoxin system Phd/YefM family antitoxin [Oscillospiraceae bacterium]|nr:type II toxin-antitoxin system Phd/YefM family antitoxin [Oscillospiraceae bacterium]
MTVTATEFKLNLGKYLALAETEEIHISRNGKVSVKLVSNNQDKVGAMKSLFGCIPADITPEEAREERLGKI